MKAPFTLFASAALAAALAFPALAHAQRNAQQEYDAALAAAKDGRLDSAMAGADRAVRLDANLAKAYKLRGDLHQRARRDEEALAEYKLAEKLDPNDARLYVSRSALRISQGLYKTALKDCERAIELDPTDADGFYNRGCALYLGGNVEAARKDAEKAVKLRPAYAEALYLSGISKGELYEEEAALAEIDEALKLNPHIPGGLMSMAVLLYESKRYDEAVTKFTEVISNDTAELAAAHYYRGDSYYHLENKEKACEDFTESMRLGDKDAAFIKKNYCDTDLTKIPKKPVKKKRKSMIEF